MKKRFQLLVFLTFVQFGLNSQSVAQNITAPKETIFLHQNSSFLMSGEKLFFKINCLNRKTGAFSDFSKIAYVELISANKQAVFSTKVRLNQGQGQGELFIPANLPSGNYKVVAFTQWMRNGTLQDFFQSDLLIVNPFQSDQGAIVSTDSLARTPLKTSMPTAAPQTTGLKMNLSQDKIAARQKMTLTIEGLEPADYGNFSVSVRKKDYLGIPDARSAGIFTSNDANSEIQFSSADQSGRTYLPELRGEILSGTIYNTADDQPAQNVKIGLSIPDQNPVFKLASSNAKGKFFFVLDDTYTKEQAVLQIVGNEDRAFRYKIDPFQSPDYSDLEIADYKIDERVQDQILKHSIDNQIENAYANVKVDSLAKVETVPPFYSKPSHVYDLDDYTRFPTIKETITEVVEQASTRQRDGKQSIHVRVYDDDVESGLRSLLLIDGLFIQDHNSVVEAKAYKIKRISVVNEQYLYGAELFEGIISMESYEGDFLSSLPNIYNQQTELFIPQADKTYYKQDYSYPKRYQRIPDYRNQLLWEPSWVLDEEVNQVEFYTSDVVGTFEVRLEGYSSSGKPISLRHVFEVEGGDQ